MGGGGSKDLEVAQSGEVAGDGGVFGQDGGYITPDMEGSSPGSYVPVQDESLDPNGIDDDSDGSDGLSLRERLAAQQAAQDAEDALAAEEEAAEESEEEEDRPGVLARLRARRNCDDVADWVDSDGQDCSVYESFPNLCSSGPSSDDGVTPSDACCACK